MSRVSALPAFLGKKYGEKDDAVLAGTAKAGDPMPNIVTISNTARNKEDTKPGEKVIPVVITVPAERFEYPQFDTLDEFVSDCGGLDKALEVINDVTRDAATRDGKNVIRMATSGSEEDMIASGLRACRNYTWKQDSTLSAKEKLGRIEELGALYKSGKLTPEELAERFLALGQ